jgi:hypothetical protein
MKLDLKSLSKDELISILQELEDAEPGKVSRIVEAWNTSPHYRSMKHKIRAVLDPMLDRGFLARRHVRSVVSKMRKLLKEIDNAYSEELYDKTFWSGMAMIETWNHQLCHTDDSSGYVSPLVDSCWATVEAAAVEEQDPVIRASFANYLLKIIKEDGLGEWDWWINPIELLWSMDPGLEIEKELLSALNQPRSEWSFDRLARIRLDLTERVHGKQAAEDLKPSLMHLKTIRLMEIEAALDLSDYQRAIDLCIEAAEHESHRPWKATFWMTRLLEISEIKGDTESRKMALTHLVLHESKDVQEHWAKLRPLLSDAETNKIIETITTPDSNKMLDVSKETVIVLLGSEGRTNQLLEFLKDNCSPQALEVAELYLPTQKQALAQLWKQEILHRLSYHYSSQTAWMFAEYLQNVLRLVGSKEALVIKKEILLIHPLKTVLKTQFDEIV